MPSSACPLSPQLYRLSLHDALPIWRFLQHDQRSSVRPVDREPDLRFRDPFRLERASVQLGVLDGCAARDRAPRVGRRRLLPSYLRKDRKSTRLNSSHVAISYAVFCLSALPPALPPFPTRRSSDLAISAARSAIFGSASRS